MVIRVSYSGLMEYLVHLTNDSESQVVLATRDGGAAQNLAPQGPDRARARTHDDGSIRRALEVAGNRSALLIMREACYGTTRFDDFAARAGISEPVAATRLRDLVEHGLLRREPYRDPGQRTRMAYRLTDMGAGLLPVLIALQDWGDRWLTGTRGDALPAPALRHRGCGAPVMAELRCAAGHRPDATDLDPPPATP
jgi:DNA-binding HxlR family transcriptional regulator